jgi:hypothetical protein
VGVRGLAEGDSGTGGTTTNVYGVQGDARDGGAGTVSNVYGGQFFVLKETAATATLANAIGSRSEVEIDGNTITNTYAAQHIIDIDGGTLTNAYITYGAYEGTIQAGCWNLYYPSNAPSYVNGEFRLGANTDLGGQKLQVSGDARITGIITAATFSGSGASLTSLNASNISSGTLNEARLPFMPVQQGGGTSQTTNKLYIGWSAGSVLRLQIDSTDFGSTWPIGISGNAATADLIDRNGILASSAVNYRVLLGAASNTAGYSLAYVVTDASRLFYNPSTDTLSVGTLSGNATTATNLSSNRTFALTGDVTGSVSSNLASGASIAATVVDNSHNHSTSTLTDVESGIYTPTFSNFTSVTSASTNTSGFFYIRVGNRVTVNGRLTIDPSITSGDIVVRCSYPITPSTPPDTTYASGVMTCRNGTDITGVVQSVTSNTADVAFAGSCTTGNATVVHVQFMYRL